MNAVATESIVRVASIEITAVLRQPRSPLRPAHGPVTRLAGPAEHRAPTPPGRCASIETPASSPHVGRPGIVGLALASVEGLALGRDHREAGDRHRMAPARLSPVLEVEESPAQRTARCATRRTRPDPRAVHRESAVGCASDSRGAAEVGRLDQPVDGRQVHAATSTSTITDVANVPHEPREPDHGRRPLCRADRDAQDALRARHPRTRASADCSGGRHRPSHSSANTGRKLSECYACASWAARGLLARGLARRANLAGAMRGRPRWIWATTPGGSRCPRWRGGAHG